MIFAEAAVVAGHDGPLLGLVHANHAEGGLVTPPVAAGVAASASGDLEVGVARLVEAAVPAIALAARP